MFRSRDLRAIFQLEPQDLQYLVTGGFIAPVDTISKGPRGRRLYDLRNAFEVGVLSSLRVYRVDYRTGFVLLKVLREILESLRTDVSQEPSLQLFQMMHKFSPFETLDIPAMDYYLDLKDKTWAGMHLKNPKTRSILYPDAAFKLILVSQGQHRDEYRVEPKRLEKGEGEVFWTDYEALVSVNLVMITRKISDYVTKHPGCLAPE